MITISGLVCYLVRTYRFILQDLDEVHLFVTADVAQQLQVKLDELMELNSFNPLEPDQSHAQKSKNASHA